MRVVTFNRMRLESGSANSILTVHTGAALARAGSEVTVYTDLAADPRTILEAYAVPPSPGLTIRNMGWRWHRLVLPLIARRLLDQGRGGPGILLLREVRPYVPILIRAARYRGMKIAFEAHNAAGKIAFDALGLPCPGSSAGRAAGAEPASRAVAAAHARAALEREILAHVDVLVPPQKLTLEALRDLLRPGAAAFVIPNGTILPPPMPPVEKDIDILYLGSLSAWKGVDTLVAAMPRLHPYRLTIVGGRDEGDRRRLRRMADDLGCAERVVFVPPVRPTEVWSWYARARLGVVTLDPRFLEAREYTCPVKLMEMLGAGLPIVAARTPAIEEIVRDGEEALLAGSRDPEEYAAAIRRILEDPGLANRLAANARAKGQDLTYDRHAERLLEAFRAVL